MTPTPRPEDRSRRTPAGRLFTAVETRIHRMKREHRLIRADFGEGARTMYDYLRTHRNRYSRRVGAHFFLYLYEAGPEVLERFGEKSRTHGWHFPLDAVEREALLRARDTTCLNTRIAGLRYATNVVNQLFNRKQVGRMIGLGAAAGSAGILLALSELFFFAREFARDTVERLFGVTWRTASEASAENAEFVALAREITEGAVTADGTLDADIVAARIAGLVDTLEAAGDAEQAITYVTADISYVVGILTGIVLLVLGRGIATLAMEGLNGTVAKIDALVDDLDSYAEWRLGRSPYALTPELLTLDDPLAEDAAAARAEPAEPDPRAPR